MAISFPLEGTVHLPGLIEGFRVRHIASSHLITCNQDEDKNEVLLRPELSGFDQIPITDGDKIVGVLERGGNPRRPIDDSLLVSSEQPLSQFVRTLKNQRYRLVLTGTSITGIVTWSDMMKPPVFVFVYSLISHLEILMTGEITSQYPQNSWLDLLDKEAKGRIIGRYQRWQKANIALELIECADLEHKASILRDRFSRNEDFGRELQTIISLRHSTDHVKDYVKTSDDLKKFVYQIELAESWIARLLQRKEDFDQTKKAHA